MLSLAPKPVSPPTASKSPHKPAKRLTEAAIDKLPIRAARYDVFDGEVPALAGLAGVGASRLRSTTGFWAGCGVRRSVVSVS